MKLPPVASPTIFSSSYVKRLGIEILPSLMGFLKPEGYVADISVTF